jgi:hypothetical protein
MCLAGVSFAKLPCLSLFINPATPPDGEEIAFQAKPRDAGIFHSLKSLCRRQTQLQNPLFCAVLVSSNFF